MHNIKIAMGKCGIENNNNNIKLNAFSIVK